MSNYADHFGIVKECADFLGVKLMAFSHRNGKILITVEVKNQPVYVQISEAEEHFKLALAEAMAKEVRKGLSDSYRPYY